MTELAWFLAGVGATFMALFILFIYSTIEDGPIEEDWLDDNSTSPKKWHNKGRLVNRGNMATVAPTVVKTKKVKKSRKKRKIPVRKGN